ncbi:hypothetical protein [Deinococcus ruber]|nr:hypothetical protein [Deinococcus ruber]
MKLWGFLLVLVLSTSVQAEPTITGRSPKNLKGVTLCLDERFVVTSDALADTVKRDFSVSQFSALKTKLTAYRVPILTNCYANGKTVDVFVIFDSAGPIGTNNARSWNINLLVSTAADSIYPDGTDIYSDWDGGVTVNYTVDEEKTYIATKFSAMIDSLAANYATANPLK